MYRYAIIVNFLGHCNVIPKDKANYIDFVDCSTEFIIHTTSCYDETEFLLRYEDGKGNFDLHKLSHDEEILTTTS